MKKGQYVCPECGQKFAWGFGFTEKAPQIPEEERIRAVCPPCLGLEFKAPIEILTGQPLQ